MHLYLCVNGSKAVKTQWLATLENSPHLLLSTSRHLALETAHAFSANTNTSQKQILVYPNSKYKYRIGTFFQLNTTLSSKWQTESEQILLLHVSNLWCWFLLLTGGGGFGVLWQDKGELSKGRYLGQPADDEVVTLSLIFGTLTSCETKRGNYLGRRLSPVFFPCIWYRGINYSPFTVYTLYTIQGNSSHYSPVSRV